MIRLLISVDPFVVRAAKVVKSGLNVFIIKKRAGSNDSIVGNIYKGVVRDVVPQLGAAFVDIGLDKNAFLCIDSSCVDLPTTKRIDIEESQEVMVQVFKPKVSDKGPKVTMNITIAGNYLVLLRGTGFIGVSKQIMDKERHSELKEILRECKNDNVGFIARTASSSATKEEILREAEYLKSICRSLDEKFERARAPAVLYEEPPIPIKVIREYCDDRTEEVVIDDKDVYKKTAEYFEKTRNRNLRKLVLYDLKEPIFRHFKVEKEIRKLTKSTVRLKSGGYITIEKTEAFFAIDVNAGGYRFFGSNVEESIFRVNMEAAHEVFKQINLRDMGGLIIVDFIDMTNQNHIEKLQETLYTLAKKDKRKTYVGRISELGVVEISRRKSNTDIFDEMFEKCPYCYNRGLVKSVPLVCSEIYERIKYSNSDRFRLRATPDVINYFKKYSNISKDIDFVLSKSCNPEEYLLEVIK